MERDIVGKKPNFRPRPRSNFYRVMLYLSLILAGIWLLLGLQRGQVKTPFQPTPTPTRSAQSYYSEAQSYFAAGKLDVPKPPEPTPTSADAINTYQTAIKIDSGNAQAWAELARIQTYSSSMLRNDTEKLARLQEALNSADQAVKLSPDDSTIHAIRAFVLDWYASNPLAVDKNQELLNQAYGEALKAVNLDNNNALGLAYYAEVLVDQQKWAQAERYALQAVTLNKDLMDTHRVYGYVLESLGQYNKAIEQYQKATEINPNLTFIYVLIGQLYREGIKNPDLALEYFARAANINKQLNVQNPLPYIEIAKTYVQQGQFFVAANNAETALSFDSANPGTYGQLGEIFIKARNYEGAKPLLQCAVHGCTAAENEMGKTAVQGLPMTNLSVAYVYVEYGTVLAFLTRLPDENYCLEAYQVLEEVRAKYSSDPTIMSIVEDSEGLCRRVTGSGPVASGASGLTPTPRLSVTPAPSTPTPY